MSLRGYAPYTKIHSEMDAYSKARGIMDMDEPFESVNIRLTKTGLIKDSRPCNRCFVILKSLDCKRIWFTTDNGTFEKVI